MNPTTAEFPHDHFHLAGTLSAIERESFSAATYYSKQADLSKPPERAYLDALPEAWQQILFHLVGGLLRDRPDPFPAPEIVDLDDLTDPTLRDDLDTEIIQSNIAHIVADISIPSNATRISVLRFPASDVVVIVPIEATFGFARHTFVAPFWKCTSSTTDVLTHPYEVVQLLEEEGVFPDDTHVERFTREIHQSVANLALAHLAKTVFRRQFSTEKIDLFDQPSEEDDIAADSFAVFERLVTDGHPFHPGAKIRDGMSPTDSLLYAPEFTPSIDIRFVAVRSDTTLQTNIPDCKSFTEQLTTQVPDLKASLDDALPAHASSNDYAVIPVHPWQYVNTIAPRFEDEYQSDTVVPLPECTVSATPLLSLRTAVPYADETRDRHPPHLKLSANVRLTNTIRTLAPESVYNGPRLSTVLSKIESDESFDRFGILLECAAACYYPHSTLQTEYSDLAEQLSALIRQNPYEHRLVEGDAQPITVASLLADSPTADQPIVCDVIDEFARQTDTTSSDEAAQQFFKMYCRAVIPGPLTLLCKYGIALEAHPQNICLVVRDGMPVGTLVRDLAGIRVNPERLSMGGYTVDTYPASMVITSDTDALYNKLYYALFQNHLTELIVVLTQHTELDETAFWEIVRRQCQDTFTRLRVDVDIPEVRLNRDEQVLFSQSMNHKALTAMRLSGETYDYVMQLVPNPLAR